MIPEIAIIGHPNEGKSSVLSTLAEDDSVVISPLPGETTRCRTFPIVIDNREILRFTDTPGFQNPVRLLAELKRSGLSGTSGLEHLHNLTSSRPEFREDHELIQPLRRGSGLIYVVDGSRPPRQVDRAEMELLRRLGRPRMAVLNCKRDEERFLPDWKEQLTQHFNSWRLFNAHRATYAERIDLLTALTSIDQDWQPVLNAVISAFEHDWQRRVKTSADIICTLLTDVLTLKLYQDCRPGDDEGRLRDRLFTRYSRSVIEMEQTAQQQLRPLFKHNIFTIRLPPHSLLHEDLFSERTWQLLGLSKKQMLLLGSLGGAAVGAGVDVAALGHGLGLFTVLGGAAGMITALAGRRHLKADASLLGLRLAGSRLQIGPAQSISLLFVLVNRQLLFFRHIINWAHGRRDYPEQNTIDLPTADAFTRSWSSTDLRVCQAFFQSLHRSSAAGDLVSVEPMQGLLEKTLMQISHERG
ncbi:GTPase/DUF3482 domain-containing protein [Desulfofustis limnaeus]|jgi:hypothetical protein|uniref:G domain-containing protein n=1 Tax=Desulfofustis limnaeus TaxID=2740163 RepID=A0ABM7WD27_9BACT|nr:GTPase/DUF3482 domain-containing protein [Desulfofustis limnaeus]MDX9895023.1 GTPase/DUF3482 domain-containing protein [Desulfofustis sp.]BDD88819.1 hypothetical protein DPPLL_31840 [Desulfofustis limnaeus]